jgi:hypothetical protein
MSHATNQEGSNDWVALQHKTMTRWINSKIEEEITDLQYDLLDGLVLVKLINKIIVEIADKNPQAKLYSLHPVYKKPTFMLQKYENVNDFLQFVQVVLKINICNISADNIVEGNLKLILGLIWSIFIFATTNSMPSSSDGTSFIKVKQILLEWVNLIVRKKGLNKVTNFDRDWSLEINRPDLIFLGILDYYLPIEVPVEPYSKRLQNMNKIFEIAKTVSIPQLADSEDFTLFVPEEKCIVTYVLEWFKVFQLGTKFDSSKDNSTETAGVFGVENKDVVETVNDLSEKLQEPCIPVHSPEPLNAKKNKVVLDRFIETIVSSARQKQKYENKSLLLCNRTNMIISKIVRNTYYFNDFSIDYLIDSLDEFFTMFSNAYNCMDGSFSSNIKKALHRFATIKIKFKILIEILEEFESYRSDTKTMLMYNNLPELKKISMDIQNSLNSIGVTTVYKPPPSLSLSSCVDNISELTGSNEQKFVKLAKKGIKKLQTSPLKRINDYLKIVEKNLNDAEQSDMHRAQRPMIVHSLDSIDYLINISHNLDYFSRNLEINQSTSGLKSLLESSIDSQHTLAEPNYNVYKAFKSITSNRTHLSEAELTNLLHASVTHKFMNSKSNKVLSFMKLIPNIDLSTDRSDISFAILYASDESDDNNSLFDGLQKSKHNDDRAYDIGGFIERLDNGFQI